MIVQAGSDEPHDGGVSGDIGKAASHDLVSTLPCRDTYKYSHGLNRSSRILVEKREKDMHIQHAAAVVAVAVATSGNAHWHKAFGNHGDRMTAHCRPHKSTQCAHNILYEARVTTFSSFRVPCATCQGTAGRTGPFMARGEAEGKWNISGDDAWLSHRPAEVD